MLQEDANGLRHECYYLGVRDLSPHYIAVVGESGVPNSMLTGRHTNLQLMLVRLPVGSSGDDQEGAAKGGPEPQVLTLQVDLAGEYTMYLSSTERQGHRSFLSVLALPGPDEGEDYVNDHRPVREADAHLIQFLLDCLRRSRRTRLSKCGQ